jgi:threonine synthase
MGTRPQLPARMADLFDRPERVTRTANDLRAIQSIIRERTGH